MNPEVSEISSSFSSLGVMPELIKVLGLQQINTPTPIQAKAIPPCLNGTDLIACARTGTGKTLAFALPLFTRLKAHKDSTALILVPTRELAMQVADALKPFMNALHMYAPCLIIGGTSMQPQLRALQRKPLIIVATPGRLLDHIRQRTVHLNKVNTLILDEADRMLDMGFLPQIKEVIRVIPKERQTLLFSATFDPTLERFAKELTKDAQRVQADPPSSMAITVTQSMRAVAATQKHHQLLEELNKYSGTVLVFARTKRRTDKAAQFLSQYGISTDSIHGDRSQGQRKRALDAFRQEKIRVLVATDVAARGLDIPHVGLVINFDLPDTREDYVHRIGRTGRAERSGEALSFVSPEEKKLWAYISSANPTGKAPVNPNAQRSSQKPRMNKNPHGQKAKHAGARPSGQQKSAPGKPTHGRRSHGSPHARNLPAQV